MIVYKSDIKGFFNDILTGNIDYIINNCLLQTLGFSVGASEQRAYRNSLQSMFVVLSNGVVPNDCGVCIEYNIPNTGKRIDFMISGYDGNGKKNVVVIELKQWSEARLTDLDGIVETILNYHWVQTLHPSRQVSSYVDYLRLFNTSLANSNISLDPCAFLHNYQNDSNSQNVIRNSFYDQYLTKAPVFVKDDIVNLQRFIKRFIVKGDKGGDVLVELDKGKMVPSPQLCDKIRGLMAGREEYVLLDDQKIVFENLLKIALKSSEHNKNVIIVQGGPGTGKSVVAVKLIMELIHKYGKMAQYVTKTSAPRDLYFSRLKVDNSLKVLKNLFVGSGSFQTAPAGAVHTLVVDESHRLTEKTGFLKRGYNQIYEIIKASNCSIFFIDEGQRVSIEDYGSIDNIKYWARKLKAKVHYGELYELKSQFRCNGSNGYLDWLNQSLSNLNEEEKSDFIFNFDFKVFDSAESLQEAIFRINSSKEHKNKARLVAGYCWKWDSESVNNPNYRDIVIGDKFAMSWNLRDDGGLFIDKESGVDQVGCIHTSQGLETDYIGVIIGPDMIYKDGKVQTDVMKRASTDKTVAGRYQLLKEDKTYWTKQFDLIIKNTYKVLMTRGMNGCYVYCTDALLRDYLKSEFSNHHRALYKIK